MLDLEQSLKLYDLGHLRIISGFWGVELESLEQKSVIQQLVSTLLESSQVKRILEELPPDTRVALEDLRAQDGMLPWSIFARRYGDVREAGPAKRDRQRLYAHPANPTEVLWYRALIARAFLDTPNGPQEFAIIPTDLLTLLPLPTKENSQPPGTPATTKEHSHLIPANDHILDHACTLLALLRCGLAPELLDSIPSSLRNTLPPETTFPPFPLSLNPLQNLLNSAVLLDEAGIPAPEATRSFLECSRGEALAKLARSWQQSDDFNELRMLPGLICEGDWQNDPLRARTAILELLSRVPAETWWSLPAFVNAVREIHPDFQRPAGDYDSWYIRDLHTNVYLRGYEHWDEVEGALIRYILAGPLHWLGIVELASREEGKPVTAFRFTPWAVDLLRGVAPEGLPIEEIKLLVSANAQIHASWLAPRAVRYQVSRFCDWLGERQDGYFFQITPASLARSRNQGLRVNYLLSMLTRHAQTVPPTLVKALQRWEEHGSEARIEQAWILRLRTPDQMQKLRDSRASRFLGDLLGPTAVMIKPDAWEKVLSILAEMGYLGEIVEEK